MLKNNFPLAFKILVAYDFSASISSYMKLASLNIKKLKIKFTFIRGTGVANFEF